MTDEQIKRIKELYHPGVTVKLISMREEPQIPAGIKGRVTYVDDKRLPGRRM